MNLERFADDLPNGVPRIERAERVLKDHLHLAPQRPEVRLGHGENVFTFKEDRAGRGWNEL